jgi:3'(2'), 5'-bisphosphate nucleotidase
MSFHSEKYLKELLDNISELSQKAGAELINHRKKKNKELNISQKIDGSLVTKADFASNEIILSGLRKLTPQLPVLSEESTINLDFDRHEYGWIVDPLDGTKPYIEGSFDFSVLIALVKDNQPILAVMYFPAKEELLTGMLGEGTKLNGSKLEVSKNTTIQEGHLSLRHCRLDEEDKRSYPEWLDSCAAFSKIAKAELDAVLIRHLHHKVWDVAAPALIIEGAGGKLTNEKGEKLIYSPTKFMAKYIIASNSLTHKEALAAIMQAVSKDV